MRLEAVGQAGKERGGIYAMRWCAGRWGEERGWRGGSGCSGEWGLRDARGDGRRDRDGGGMRQGGARHARRRRRRGGKLAWDKVGEKVLGGCRRKALQVGVR